jgi:hypothetical protein
VNRHHIELFVGLFLLLSVVALLLFTWREGHRLSHYGG